MFTGYPYVTEGEMMSGDPLAAADWLRIAFHESGQFMWNGEYGTGDDGSMWLAVTTTFLSFTTFLFFTPTC